MHALNKQELYRKWIKPISDFTGTDEEFDEYMLNEVPAGKDMRLILATMLENQARRSKCLHHKGN
jgi:hypothetical protein